MGIPKFFTFLSKHFSKIVKKTQSNQSKIDWLGFDFNSLMHPVCGEIAHQNPKIDWRKSKQWDVLFEAIRDRFASILKEVKSAGTVYIAIDGVVPFAKILQQRQRRFRAELESSYKKRGEINWDSCLISPGTIFMTRFESYFHSQIESGYFNTLKGYESTKFILHDSKQFGEGEHKIMKQIRALKEPSNIIIYGLDADLIILAIQLRLCNQTNVHLLRENVYCAIKEFDKDAYILVEIETLWKAIVVEIETQFKYHRTQLKELYGVEPAAFELEDSSLIQDFILLSCYFGNDFLPEIPAFSLSMSDSVWVLINNYAKTLAEEGCYMVKRVTSSVYEWSKPFLLKFWGMNRKVEDKRMGQRTAQWMRFLKQRPRGDKGGRMKKEPITVKSWMSYESSGKMKWMQRKLSSANTYLKVFSGEDPHFNYEESSIQSVMVREWLRGSIWVLSYYTGINVDSFWYYPFQASPSMLHLIYYHTDVISETNIVQVIPTYISKKLRYKFKKPTLMLQHICIVPKSSEYIVSPKRFRAHYSQRARLTKYVEDVSCVWSYWFHECYPKMPLIHLRELMC